jgi:uncharacterized membrane protein required for colicin V production
MTALAAIDSALFNWYDWVVVAALVYGVISGVRTGLSGEIMRLIALILTIAAALYGFVPVGDWLNMHWNWVHEVANMTAFIVIAVVVYSITLGIRWLIRKAMAKKKDSLTCGAMLENFGGAVAGVLRVLLIMVWLTIMFTLIRSDIWHQQIAKNSQFGSFVVKQVPAAAAMVEKKFPEKLWIFKDIERPEEPTADGPAKPQKL